MGESKVVGKIKIRMFSFPLMDDISYEYLDLRHISLNRARKWEFQKWLRAKEGLEGLKQAYGRAVRPTIKIKDLPLGDI